MDRRTFIKRGSALVAISGALDAAARPPQQPSPEPPVDTGIIKDGKLLFPNEGFVPQGANPGFGGALNQDPPDRRVGFAILGLGRLSTENIMPAFGRTKHARLAGLITGTPEKGRLLASQYGLSESRIYGYNDFDRIRDAQDIQAIYVVTPNALHHEHVLRSAGAGKHVLCEKPMAASAREAQEMVDACAKANRKLMIAYRMQYDPYMRALIQLCRGGELGKIKAIIAANMQDQGDPNQWRLKKALAGGGSLYDIGVYCLNASRAITGEEPVEVSARIQTDPNDPRFHEVEESVYWTLRFPSGIIATLSTSYSNRGAKFCNVACEQGNVQLDPAYFYHGNRLFVDRRQNDSFSSTAEWKAGDPDHFALEMDHLAVCIRRDIRPRTPGEEGLADHKVFEAIYESADSGRIVTLPRVEGLDTTRGPEPVFD
ncbi:MAG: Gfo/Idh/MocA family protein [Candidatus Acidiferrales bacterium]